MVDIAPTVKAALPTEQVDSSTQVQASASEHPLDPLSPKEIEEISIAIRLHTVETQIGIQAIKFVTSSIISPPKRDVLAFLRIPVHPGMPSEPPSGVLARRAESDFIDPVTGNNYNAALTYQKAEQCWRVDCIDKLPEEVHPQITVEELIECEKIVRNDERVLKLAADVGITNPEHICADGWSIGWDSRWPNAKRIQQCLLYARFGEHENLYAHPLDFIPVVDANAMTVLHIDFPPHRLAKDGQLSGDLGTIPPSIDNDSLEASGRPRIPPPLAKADYLPDLLEDSQREIRDPLKPLHIVQPDGVSFKISGNVLEWQNWKMHIGFSGREGIALSTITYSDHGEVRPIVYRLSLAEMVVPYAAPEHPHPRKFAFDVGEYGMGTQANELSLGCDCVGAIHYMPGAFVAHDGKPTVLKNAICIHEEDAGVLWKHTDYRVGGRAFAVRSRRLVISMVCTVANYEYIFAYQFYLDGTIELETRLTGILNVYLLAEGESASPHGTEVAPRINAQYHQHIFSLRVDPMVDGLYNTVVESDIIPVSNPAGSKENFAGNGFVSQDRRVTKSGEGARVYNAQKDRRWRIVNPSKRHFSSHHEVAYGIMAKGAWETLKCAEGSWAQERAAFASKSLWVVKEKEGPRGTERMWPAGKYVPQTRSNPNDSVLSWAQGEENLENEDLVIFLTIGLNHIPRPEDWPVMPSEHMRIALKPIGFFKENPSLHVAPADDKTSVLFISDDSRKRSETEGHTHKNACC